MNNTLTSHDLVDISTFLIKQNNSICFINYYQAASIFLDFDFSIGMSICLFIKIEFWISKTANSTMLRIREYDFNSEGEELTGQATRIVPKQEIPLD
ncbi:MAG: hypothetical protein WCE93_10615 [Nitrososphaeraceae archaeon]